MFRQLQLFLTLTMITDQIALVLWAVVFVIIFPNRAYYLGFIALLALAAGAEAIEYAPALWVPVEFILSMQKLFKDAAEFAVGKKVR